MIAIITSTIAVNNAYSFFSEAERLTQTIRTIQKLSVAGFKDIFMFDNSATAINPVEIMEKSGHSVLIFHQDQYTFENKGLNEALLLLNNLHRIPDNEPIFKISGRYYPSSKFDINNFSKYPQKDIIGVGDITDRKTPLFNTRAYYVKNKHVLESILVMAIEEMLSYSRGIRGVRSLLDQIEYYYKPHLGTKYQISMEHAFGRILKQKENYHLLKKINIEGFIAGVNRLEFIEE